MNWADWITPVAYVVIVTALTIGNVRDRRALRRAQAREAETTVELDRLLVLGRQAQALFERHANRADARDVWYGGLVSKLLHYIPETEANRIIAEYQEHPDRLIVDGVKIGVMGLPDEKVTTDVE